MFRLLTFLGTSSGTPTPFRNVSSACLALSDGRVWMFDCGEGTQHQLLRCKDISVSKIEKVFLTHLHGDHCYGLPGMLCSMSLMWTAPGVVPNATFAVKKRDGKEADGEAPEGGGEEGAGESDSFIFDHFSKTSEFLEIYGPYGTASFLREVLRSSETRFGFKYRVTELMYTHCAPNRQHQTADERTVVASEEEGHVVVSTVTESNEGLEIECEAPTRRLFAPLHVRKNEVNKTIPSSSSFDGYSFYLPADVLDPVGGISLRAAWLDHPVPSLGYSLTEPTSAGTLDMKKALELGIPKGPLLAKLKKGESISFPRQSQPANLKKSKGTSTPEAAVVDTTEGEEACATVVVHPSQVVGPDIPGRKITILGDTSNSDRMKVPIFSSSSSSDSSTGEGIATNSDWLVHESTFDDGNSNLALPRGHSTARMAGEFAKAVGAKTLIITHFSARYPPEVKDPEPIEALRRQAVEGLEGGCNESRDEHVMAAYDFLSIDLSRAAGGKLKKAT